MWAAGVVVNRERDSMPAGEVRAAAMREAEEVYSAHAPLLRVIALRKFRVPREDAEELVNDVFASYFANAIRVRLPRNYLVGAICNAARQYWRGRDEQNAIASGVAMARTIGEELIEQINRKFLVATMLARVGSRCRELLHRYYIDGETTATIAASRETTADYVLVLLHKCRKTARDVVRGLMREP